MILHARDSLVCSSMQRWQVEVDPTPRTSAMEYLEYSLDSASCLFGMMMKISVQAYKQYNNSN